jgi:hypothetical protein
MRDGMSKTCDRTEVLVTKPEHIMKTQLALLALASLVWSQLCTAQPDQPVAEDFKPSSLNQPGKQYPQVNSERRIRVRVVAPQAQNVVFEFLGGANYPLAKGEDGAWGGLTRPQDEGFHYYQLVIDGAEVPDPGSLYFYGGNRWGSGVEVPAHDADFYALKDVPHGQLRETLFNSGQGAWTPDLPRDFRRTGRHAARQFRRLHRLSCLLLPVWIARDLGQLLQQALRALEFGFHHLGGFRVSQGRSRRFDAR